MDCSVDSIIMECKLIQLELKAQARLILKKVIINCLAYFEQLNVRLIKISTTIEIIFHFVRD